MITSNIDSKKLINALHQFPIRIQKNVMTGATRAGANVVRDRARQNTPKRTGKLAKSIKTVKRKAPRGQVRFSVSPMKGGRNEGWRAHFVEFGTVHQAAQPFMRRAFEQSNNESLEASKKYIAERIPKELAKAKA